MKKKLPSSRRLIKKLITLVMLSLSIPSQSIVAQVVADETLPTNSHVTRNGNTFTIEQGTTAGVNLFHSFREFSLSNGMTARFDNSLRIENIITRVTGGKVSDIDGILRANGTANLYFLNPSGIIFGPNATLDIGGSFLGSTADRIILEEGSFDATEPNTPPLLTINVPIGLEFDNPGTIHVQDNGHKIVTDNPAFSIINPKKNDLRTNSGLSVKPGKTLALIGGNVTLDGAILTAPSGKVELGSVGSGSVRLKNTANGWTFDYQDGSNYQDIQLLNKALVNAGSGAITVQGATLKVEDGSLLLILNEGDLQSGAIQVNADKSVQVTGSDGKIGSGFYNHALGNGNGGDIRISSPELQVRDGGSISTVINSTGKTGGNIDLNVSGLIQIKGFDLANPALTSRINAFSFMKGKAGDIDVKTGRLRILDGARMASTTLGTGSGGTVTVNADSVEIMGFESEGLQPSVLSSSTVGAGNAGRLTIHTKRLIIANGGRVDSSTFAASDAGSLTIKAEEFVEVTGTVGGSVNPSLIISSANIIDPAFRMLLNISVPSVPSGNSGNILITTPILKVGDGALVNVRNDGTGNAGTLRINADSIFLDRESGITAATISGDGGNINLEVTDSLQLRNNSQIEAEAGGTGDGGNITINTDTLVILEGSSLSANAFAGDGGNISLTAQGIFTSGDSSITASSQLGVDGIVNINNPSVDPSSGLFQLQEQLLDPEDQVFASCAAALGSSFTNIGQGGLAESPLGYIRSQSQVLVDLRDFTELPEESLPQGEFPSVSELVKPLPTPIIRATGWIIHEDGTIELVASIPNRTNVPTVTCLPKFHSKFEK
ncbi:MAG: S-layer family protein [Prochloron sp. SP5CPC1]|nr:S-layer family protein [Candidatus Paraprochloron terpiosi SP5CPC1]